MSHGNVTETVGDCQICGRQDVDLCTVRGGLLVCVDEFACYDAFMARPR
jgi:hypothetical protein